MGDEMKHVHHDMIVAWAADTSRVVEVYSDSLDYWRSVDIPTWSPNCVYRFKPAEPKYIVVNGIQVPEPVRGGLEHNQEYWLVDPTAWLITSGLWSFTNIEKQWLSLGLIHLTREAAQAHSDAMLLPSRSDK
jgi:hypothetical protein